MGGTYNKEILSLFFIYLFPPLKKFSGPSLYETTGLGTVLKTAPKAVLVYLDMLELPDSNDDGGDWMVTTLGSLSPGSCRSYFDSLCSNSLTLN